MTTIPSNQYTFPVSRIERFKASLPFANANIKFHVEYNNLIRRYGNFLPVDNKNTLFLQARAYEISPNDQAQKRLEKRMQQAVAEAEENKNKKLKQVADKVGKLDRSFETLNRKIQAQDIECPEFKSVVKLNDEIQVLNSKIAKEKNFSRLSKLVEKFDSKWDEYKTQAMTLDSKLNEAQKATIKYKNLQMINEKYSRLTKIIKSRYFKGKKSAEFQSVLEKHQEASGLIQKLVKSKKDSESMELVSKINQLFKEITFELLVLDTSHQF